jgi:hypothetical protein
MTTQNTILCDDTIKIVITPKLEKILGRSKAVALQQLHFCLTSNENNGKIHEDRRWIYNTYEEWQEHYIPQYSSGTIQRAFTKLEEMNIIDSCQPEKKYGNRRKSYTINYDVIEDLISQYDQKNPSQKKPISIPSLKSISNTIHAQPPHKIVFDSIPKISSETDDTVEKCVNASSTVQPKLSDSASNMITIWNETVGKDLNQNITSYPKLLHTLNALLENYFNSDCEKWRNYCLKIASSKFLMGEVRDYRIRFSYAVSEDGVNEILHGDKYTFGDRVTLITTDEPHKSKSSNPFAPYQESEQALKLREFIKKKINSDAIYSSWYEPIYIFYKSETNEYILFAPTRFMMDRIVKMDEEIAGKFSEIHFFNGQYPKEYFGLPVHQEESRLTEKVVLETESTPDTIEITLLEHSDLTTDACDVSIQNVVIHESDKKIIHPISTSEIASIDNMHVIEPIQSGEGDTQNSLPLETDKARLLRLKIRASINPTLYESCFKDTFIVIDDEDNNYLLLKSDSKKDEIITCLNAYEINFSEIYVPENDLFEFYFGTAAQPSEYVIQNEFCEEELISPTVETQPTFTENDMSLTSSCEQTENQYDAIPSIALPTQKRSVSYHTAMIQRIVHKINMIQNSEQLIENVAMTNLDQSQRKVTKWCDDHNKMIRWSHQNDTFLTKTTPKTTPHIFSFREAYTFFNTLHDEIKIKEIIIFKKLKWDEYIHLFKKQLTWLRNILHSKIRKLNQTLSEGQNYTPNFSHFRFIQT